MNATLTSQNAKPAPTTSWRFKEFGLSRQESRVIELAMEGNIDKQIAVEMSISLGTVRVYWKRIRAKTHATRSESIARMAKDSFQSEFNDLQRRTDDLQGQLARQEETERRIKVYESAFGLLPIPFVVVEGSEGTVVRASQSFAAACGYKPDEISGLSIFAEPERVRDALSELTAKPRTCRIVIKAKNGEEVPMTFNACGGPDLPTILWAGV